MLTLRPPAQSDLEAAYATWRFAADEAADALKAWISGPRDGRDIAFRRYRAALDREAAAADDLARRTR